MLCNYCGAKTIQDDQGAYCDDCMAYMDQLPYVPPGQDAILSLDLSPHEHDDEQPRSLERFHLDDDTGPGQSPYLGEM